MKKYILLLITLIFLQNIGAQTVWYADVENVVKSGYYNIEIDQQLMGASKQHLKNLLIMDADSTEVPYFLRSASPIQEISSFENYTLKENITRDSLNIIVVDNQRKEVLSRFYLTIANADVNITTSLRGSNDLKQWYIVKQQSAVSNYGNRKGNDAVLILDFPKGDYTYYEIVLVNDQHSPLHVKGVGKIEGSNIYGQFSEIATARNIAVEEKDKNTIVSFSHLSSSYYISKAEFFISHKSDYLRDVRFEDSTAYSSRKLTLSSKGDNVFFIDDFPLTPAGIVKIYNQNNPPLTVDSVRLYGLRRYACAYLEAGKKYFVKVDGAMRSFPDYDIEHFRNDIDANAPTIKTFNISSVTQPVFEREKLFFEKPVFLWSVIIGIGLLLTFLCAGMLKSMKGRKDA